MKKVFLVLALLLVAACQPAPEPVEEGPLKIGTTFYPLYYLTNEIAGDAEVFSVLPPGAHVHGFEPSPRVFEELSDIDAYVSLGLEFEEFEEDIIDSLTGVTVIQAGKEIVLLEVEDDHKDEHEEGEHHEEEHEEEGEHADEEHEEDEHEEEHADEEHEEDEHGHAHSGLDPHIWLSPTNMIDMAINIAEELKRLDPENEQLYDVNTQVLINKLADLDSQYKEGLKECAQDTILVSHQAYNYLAHDYDFEVVGIAGIEPESEPTPQELKKLVDTAEKMQLKVVYSEPGVDPRVSETIADAIRGEVLVLNPLPSAALEDSYIDLMEENLKNLQKGLEC